MRWRDLATAGLIALAVTGGVATALPRLAGWSLDATFWLRHQTFGLRHDPAASPSVVVALDEETYRSSAARAHFGVRPQAAWTPEIAQVLDRLREAGAAVVGFDIVFAASVRDLDRGYDRDFLVALRNLAREGRVVLGRIQHSTDPIVPLPEQNIAVRSGAEGNIRALNVFSDRDGVIRSVPLRMTVVETDARTRAVSTREETSLSVELASRVVPTPPQWTPDGSLILNGRAVASDNGNLVLNFDSGSGDIPTFSFFDLVRCAQAGDDAFFRRHFAGRVVLVAVVLDAEDRKSTSKRWISGPEGGRVGARCTGPPPAGIYDERDVVREDIPGVYIHATAVNNLLRGDELRVLARAWQWLMLLAAALGATAATLLLPLLASAAAVAGASALWVAGTTVALQHAVVLPLVAPPLAAVIALGLALGYRFFVADRDKRFLRKTFALYLAPAVIDKLVDSDRLPELGGEERNATFYFSDLQGFTAISEALSAAELVALMNTYLTAMTDIIEAHGGFVDKYIGDAIAAVFGAPLDDPDHALNAVKAALACEAKLAELNAAEPMFRAHRVAQRIGINTGPALVGNIGSRRHFNYTVMGDAVNVAARLEGVNKIFGTRILAAESTVAAVGERVLWREIDRVRVLGRDHPLAIFEPLALGAGEADARARAATHAAALAAWRRRDFAAAAELLGALAGDRVAERFATRARALAAAPPPADWEPVTNLETK